MERVKFDEKNLVPVVVQDDETGKVLTLCYMNREALDKTLREGKVYVYRRSKKALMLKGATSGHVQKVKSVFIDCEGNSLLIRVEQKTAACHTGYFTCYYRRLLSDGSLEIVEKKVFNPKDVYK